MSEPSFLIVRFSSIGDVLLTTPLIRAIHTRYPAAPITAVTKEAYAPLLSHHPALHRVIGVDRERRLTSLAAELRQERYTHLLDLHDSARSRMLRLLVPGRWSSYPKHRVARALLIHAKRDFYRDRRPVAERYFSSAEGLGLRPDGAPPDFFLSSEEERLAGDWLEREGLGRENPLVVVAPGAAHTTKRWPVAHWLKLTDRLIGSGADVVVVGSGQDVALGHALAAADHGRIVNAAGVFGLQATGALLSRAAAVVSGDTGIMHMATAVRTPVIALFGPTVQAFGFFPYTEKARVIQLALPCRPCSSKGGPRCPLGHHRCMVEIEPDTVYEAVRQSIG